ncbi:glutaminase kidney isoform, mitochondrial-like isoform X2 [Pristis pectinata]|uniref:glutaminase kidney isoform, mitochondrial-like isoform X2 n=1 Tax=Pristis pectinata TaxID=685728 RepID=UPI00223D13E6|nr:glutaminase kidney isoform, mitochondrial-like isoform X2 [Pristis pectinata]
MHRLKSLPGFTAGVCQSRVVNSSGKPNSFIHWLWKWQHPPGRRAESSVSGSDRTPLLNPSKSEVKKAKEDGYTQKEPRKHKPGLMPGLEDMLFYTITEGQEQIPIPKFISALKSTGLLTSDPRLKYCMDLLRQTVQSSSSSVTLDRHLFKKFFGSNIVLLTQAFRKKFVIPDFEVFSSHINRLYENARMKTGGKVADYIPQLAKFSPDLWGVSLCTVDGQRHSIGDTKIPFCLQSCIKPLEYAIAVNEFSTDYVHQYVGKEPSGLRFNKVFLNEEDKPHNPMVNAGAIVITSLIKPGANKAEKFDCVMHFLNKMAGNEYVGFSNATFQSEKETGDRNFAIGYYLKEKKCFPEGVDMIATLDFYFQLCSIEVTCESGGVMAATLANGGICPITGERILSAEAVRNTLSLMHSCGMYDFSGEFAFHELVSLFNFHNYDNLRHFARKLDPRRNGSEAREESVVNLLFAAYSGDIAALRRFALSAMDMEQKDYDSRTPLHIAAAEGHVEVVCFLLDACRVNPFCKDRWGNTPLDDAIHFNHQQVAKLLRNYQMSYPLPETAECEGDTSDESTGETSEGGETSPTSLVTKA